MSNKRLLSVSVLFLVFTLLCSHFASAEKKAKREKPIHIKLKLDKDKTAQEVGRDFYEAVEGNLWCGFLIKVANKGKGRFKMGEEVEIPILRFKSIEIPEDWYKENGKLDWGKVEKATGLKKSKLLKKNRHLEGK